MDLLLNLDWSSLGHSFLPLQSSNGLHMYNVSIKTILTKTKSRPEGIETKTRPRLGPKPLLSHFIVHYIMSIKTLFCSGIKYTSFTQGDERSI